MACELCKKMRALAMATTRRRRTKDEIARQREKLKVRAQLVQEQERKETAMDNIRMLRNKLRGM